MKSTGLLVVVVASACMSTGPETASPSLQPAHTVVSLTFDDVLADQAQVGAMAAAHGFHVTFFDTYD